MRVCNNGWDKIINEELQKDYFQRVCAFVHEEYEHHTVFPPKKEVFNALSHTPPEEVRVVILGQDPYHELGQGHGLCFSVRKGVKFPPSLVNIFKEMYSDIGVKSPVSGDLSSWASQGVLLLNTTLTVREGLANSHSKIGWNIFTDRIISEVNKIDRPVVYILWGANARSKKALINNPRHFIIESAHPSPLSAHNGFFGSRPFSRANDFLTKNGQTPINWNSVNENE